MAAPFSQSRAFPASSSTRNVANATRQAPTTKPPPVDLPALQNASRVLLEQLAKDAQIIPDLGETLTASGSQFSASYSVFPDDIRVPFQKRKFVSIPEGLFQYYDSVNVTSHMGLMSEIERVWVSIDHKLFLWDYMDGQDISSFVDQPDVITHVALVKPKSGLFIDDITSLLVICTPVSVLLLGLAIANQTGMDGRLRKDIKLYATDLTISTDIEMTSVIGTADGRIFMCGHQDGNLYEMHYQASESWFGKRVQLINHSMSGVQSLLPRFASSTSDDRIIATASDTKRNCFYTLSSRNTISLYTPNGDKSIQHIQTLSSLYKSAQEKAPGSPAITPQNFQIISIHVVDPSESRMGIQLIAITTNGVRLFFGPSMTYGYSFGSGSGGLRTLALLHIRLPPLNLIHPDEQEKRYIPPISTFGASQAQKQPTSRPYIVSTLDNSCYVDGLTIASQAGDVDSTDYILCLAPDLTRIGNLGQLNLPERPQQPQFDLITGQYTNTSTSNRPPLTEYATLLSIPGRTWAMAAVPKTSTETPPGTAAPSNINELASQFDEYPNQFLLLTNVGLTFLVKRRAVEYLKAVLEELQAEGNVQPIIQFRDSFGRDQTCSMLLGLASGNTFLDPSGSSTSGTVSTVSPEIAAVAKQAFYDFGERPIWTERMTYGTAENKGSAIFSGRREGFALYFARLVRPIWKLKVTTVQQHSGMQVLNAPETLLVNIQKNLFALKEFLSRNPQLFHSSPSEPTSSRTLLTEQEAWKAEQSSVSELQTLLTRTIEALSFVLLLSDYRLNELISKCDPETQKLIAGQTFEDLITSQHGMTISRALVNVVIDQQIGQQISVDTISEVLQHRCGSFCSTDDVMLYKAKENIRKSAETRNPSEKQKSLAEALRLFTKSARIIEFEKLREVVGDFQHLNYAKGVVELPLTCAQVQDPDNAGLECWHVGMSPSDPRYELAQTRLHCYELVLDSLRVFEERCKEKLTTTPAAGVAALDDPESVRSHGYELAFASDDDMFHSTLYDWLISRDLADDLLEMRPPFLEAYLRREPATVQKFQLLWQFYVKNGQPLRAAEVLGALAESTQFDLHLDTRLEYLTLAVANAKSHPISIGGRHETAIAFLTDLEEKLDVAQVQLEIYSTLLPHVNDDPMVGERINTLSKKLLTMTELYSKYAVPFDLPAIKLLCLHVSEHRDESVVRPIWNQIFDEIMQETDDPKDRADLIMGRVVPLGQRFYPSESAFPMRFIATLLIRFTLANKDVLPAGWASRILIQCGVRFAEIWDLLNEMYESQVPPFNDQANVQTISSEISILLSDWLAEATRPQANILRSEFPAGRVDAAIDQYLAELEPGRAETKAMYENAKRQLRKYW
ncbi:nucleoporin [Pholiota conissans]|uniref:Nucleoporin n=1 Tax=Pholiota conissans TaxID=109636 RepID=A0A9P5Z4L2_9AGAR|nr:nucleoporin [Pholiota conissans]